MLKILATSDLHGYLPHIDTEFDLLLICGDICPAHDHYYSFQKEWIETDFVDWINRLPFKDIFSRVVITWGNHDFVGERLSEADILGLKNKTLQRLVVLKNQSYTHDYLIDDGLGKMTIFGTPYCKEFGNWAFMVSGEKLTKKFNQIPENVDILISHDAPSLNGFGKILEGQWAGEDASNIQLGFAIQNKKPRIALHGHIHSSRHEFKDYDGIWMSCVSYVNERYDVFYPILEFEYDPVTKEVKYDL